MARESQTRPAHAAAKPRAETSPEEALAEIEFEALGDLPAFALADFYIANSEALGLAAHNAVATQEKLQVSAQSATIMGVAQIFSQSPPAASDAPTTSPADTTPNQKDS